MGQLHVKPPRRHRAFRRFPSSLTSCEKFRKTDWLGLPCRKSARLAVKARGYTPTHLNSAREASPSTGWVLLPEGGPSVCRVFNTQELLGIPPSGCPIQGPPRWASFAYARYRVASAHFIGTCARKAWRTSGKPDRMTFDLNPGDGVAWRATEQAAELMRVFLEQLRLIHLIPQDQRWQEPPRGGAAEAAVRMRHGQGLFTGHRPAHGAHATAAFRRQEWTASPCGQGIHRLPAQRLWCDDGRCLVRSRSAGPGRVCPDCVGGPVQNFKRSTLDLAEHPHTPRSG